MSDGSIRLLQQPPLLLPPATVKAAGVLKPEAEAEGYEETPPVGGIGERGSINNEGLEEVVDSVGMDPSCLYMPCPWRLGRLLY